MFKVKDLIGKEIDTEFWLEEDEVTNAIFLKAKLTNDQSSVLVVRIDKNGMMLYDNPYENLGFKTVKRDNNKSYINVCYFSS